VTDDQISQSLFYAVVFQSIDKRVRDVHNEKVDSVFLTTVALPMSDFIMTMF